MLFDLSAAAWGSITIGINHDRLAVLATRVGRTGAGTNIYLSIYLSICSHGCHLSICGLTYSSKTGIPQLYLCQCSAFQGSDLVVRHRVSWLMRIPKALRPLRHAAAGLEPNKTLYYHPVVLGSTSPPSLFFPIKPSSPSPGLHLLAHSGMQPRGLMEGALAKAKIF